jgi:hypothetical protein
VKEGIAGAIADRYTIARELDRADMAPVYLARDLRRPMPRSGR